MILVVDNYDSFVQTLARYVREAGAETTVLRNDAMAAAAMIALKPEAVILSPGPRTPREAGVCLDLLAALPVTIPVLGVCLGCQALAEAFGGRTVRARRPLHGEASLVRHDGTGILHGLSSPIEAGRYHSLIAEIPADGALIANAWSEEGEIMGLRRKSAPWHGVQFHPESLLTPSGRAIIANFLTLCREAPR
jgi:anthranilate synthase/aminodeoxychorismate synthase-like glutamine amidotransferase